MGRKSKKMSYATPMTKREAMMAKLERVTFSTSDRATKRVIAPYVNIVRKGLSAKQKEKRPSLSLYIKKKPSVLLRKISQFLSDNVDLPSLLHETADVLRETTKAAGVRLYIVDAGLDEICYSSKNSLETRHRVSWKIDANSTIAAYVAFQKEYVMLDDVLHDDRFPAGIGYKDETVKSVLCVPVVTPDNNCFAVIELYRDTLQEAFKRDDVRIVVVVTGWMGAAIHQNQQRLALQKQQELNDYLIELTKCYFADTISLEKLISEIVSFAKVSLNAERGSFFVVDKEKDELVADLFDEGIEADGNLHKKNLKIRFNRDRGIAGTVARTGVSINVTDAYNDARFNKEIDQKTGFITRSILCMPIMGVDGILGVVQVINKKMSPCFNQVDEILFKTFTVYCALALHYSKQTYTTLKADKINKTTQRMLQFHIKPCIHDVEYFANKTTVDQLPDEINEYIRVGVAFADFTKILIGRFHWYMSPSMEDIMPQLALYFITDIVGEIVMDLNAMKGFILTVRKSYRKNPYHNFEHAFNFTHCMFCILKRNKNVFSDIESKALIVAAICHDLDHPGYTNNFLQVSRDTLVQLYDESPLENHHYHVTMFILTEYKIFRDMPEEIYKTLCAEIKDAILATDLALYFKYRTKLLQTYFDKAFEWYRSDHRLLVKALMMTICDLSGQCKPFSIAEKITIGLYREFYHQGDVEKEMGLIPLSMMDREKQHMIPEDQLQFLNVVVIPCADLLRKFLPNTEPLLDNCLCLRNNWKEILETKGQKIWRQEDSIVD